MKKILLIEDNQSFRDPLAMILSDNGYEVVEATNGKEAIEKYLESNVDLIISDIFMPEMDGMELLEYFQGNSNLPIIIMSGGSPEGIDLISAAQELGANKVFYKPFNFDDLLTGIKELI